MIHHISAEHLTIERIGEIIKNGYKLELSDDARNRIVRCREYLDKKIAETKVPIYGVTTGFGSLCNVSIGKDHLAQLQINLMMSHACGTGDRVPNEIVKIMLLLKIQSLSYGYSGCQLETVERLIDFFNNGVYPVVYMQGSLGASGDLVPLAHLCLPLVGLGDVEYQGKVMTGAEVLNLNGWEPIRLASKEGLALLNGTQNMSAFAVWALLKSKRLGDWADTISAMSLDAYCGLVEPFTDAVHQVRPHKGQIETAARMRKLLEGSEIVSKPKDYVQDPYSFRCIPQVHGTFKDTWNYVYSVIDTEINSATDNPTVCPDDDIIISAGNFHGEPIAQPMDFLAIAACELANISERRIYKLVSGTRGLPSFLVANPGVNSGFMITQYRSFGSQPQQESQHSVFSRQHTVKPGTGRPCQHGCQCSNKTVQGSTQHGACACNRTVQRRPGTRIPPPAQVIANHRECVQGLPRGCSLHRQRRSNVPAY